VLVLCGCLWLVVLVLLCVVVAVVGVCVVGDVVGVC